MCTVPLGAGRPGGGVAGLGAWPAGGGGRGRSRQAWSRCWLVPAQVEEEPGWRHLQEERKEGAGRAGGEASPLRALGLARGKPSGRGRGSRVLPLAHTLTNSPCGHRPGSAGLSLVSVTEPGPWRRCHGSSAPKWTLGLSVVLSPCVDSQDSRAPSHGTTALSTGRPGASAEPAQVPATAAREGQGVTGTEVEWTCHTLDDKRGPLNGQGCGHGAGGLGSGRAPSWGAEARGGV